MTKRSIEIHGQDTTLNLTKVVAVDVPKKMIVFEEIKPGEWRLTYTKSLIPDLSKVSGLVIHRED